MFLDFTFFAGKVQSVLLLVFCLENLLSSEFYAFSWLSVGANNLYVTFVKPTLWSTKTMKDDPFALYIPVSPHCTISKYTQIVQIFVYFLSNNVLHMFTATKLSSTNTPAQTHSMQKSPPSPGWPRDQRFMLLQYECACYHLSGPFSNHCLFWLECKKRKKKGCMIHPGLQTDSGSSSRQGGRARRAIVMWRERQTAAQKRWPGVCGNKNSNLVKQQSNTKWTRPSVSRLAQRKINRMCCCVPKASLTDQRNIYITLRGVYTQVCVNHSGRRMSLAWMSPH